MNRNNLWISLLAILLLVSCNDKIDEEYNRPTWDESLFLNLNIMPSFDLSTKAGNDGVNGNGREEGSFLENYIDIENNDFHVVLFSSSGDFIMEFKAEEVNNKNRINDNGSYSLGIELDEEKLLKFPKNFTTDGLTVIILANWKSFTGREYESFTGKNIKYDLTGNIWTDNSFYNFDYLLNSEASWVPKLEENSGSFIPMTGITKFVGFPVSPVTGKPTANVSLMMVRSLAKITLSLKDDLWKSGFEIGSCELNTFVTKGKMIPDMSKEENSLGEDGDFLITLPWDTSEVEKKGPISLVKIGEEGTNPILTAYVTEMFTSSSKYPSLTASLFLNQEKFKEDKVIELKDYQSSSNDFYHILRNHHYNFVIDITGSEEIEVSYTVCPWEVGNVEIGFH